MGKHEQELGEAKRLERVFIFHRWLYIPAVLLTAWLYNWLSPAVVALMAGGLGLFNIIAYFLNRKISNLHRQTILGLILLAVDALAAWWLIIIGIRDHHAAIYVVFSLIIIEAAIRFGLRGSLIMDIVFALGLYWIWSYSLAAWDGSYVFADYVLMVGVMSFVSLMVGMVAREWRKQRRYAEALAAERASLLERRRISNELHDSVLKSLQGLALEAYAFGRNKCPVPAYSIEEWSGYIGEVCRQMSQEIRGVILDLRDDDGREDIIAQITKLVEDWSGKTGIAIEYKHSGGIPPLPLKLEHDIQKVLAEALSNVKRHAGASQVYLSLAMAEGQLNLNIRDNGHGFPVDLNELYSFVRKGKLGLVSMKERVELAGGRFNIESGEGGTVLSACIPVPDDRFYTESGR